MAENEDSPQQIATTVALLNRLAEMGFKIFLETRQGKKGLALGQQEFERWEDRAKRFLAESVSESEAAKFAKVSWVRVAFAPQENFERRCEAKIAFLNALRKTLEEDPGIVLGAQIASPRKNLPSSRRVFIVHGHDQTNRYRLQDLLEKRFRLQPIILQSEPGMSRPLIQKFEEVAEDCGFAFVLMTPDDQVRVQSPKDSTEELYAQSRPNVIFELGWFCGHIGRERVCILYKRGTGIHTDLAGVSRVEFVDSIEEKVLDIERELVAAKLIPPS